MVSFLFACEPFFFIEQSEALQHSVKTSWTALAYASGIQQLHLALALCRNAGKNVSLVLWYRI